MLIDLLMFGFWIVLVVYVFWFLFKAKTVQPLTLDDLALTWKVHKQESGFYKASELLPGGYQLFKIK